MLSREIVLGICNQMRAGVSSVHATMLPLCLTLVAPNQAPEPVWLHTLERMLDAGLEVGGLLLSFTLAIFVVLVFAVRALLIIRKLPVPVDPVDMAKPKVFRALMLGSATVLAPPVALEFLPVDGLDLQWVLVVVYGVEALLVVVLWLILHLFYNARTRRSGPGT